MAKNLIRPNEASIHAAIITGETLLDRLSGRCANRRKREYDELDALLDAMPISMDYEEHLWLKSRLRNAKNAVESGEAIYEIRLLIQRLRHRHAAAI